MSELMDIIDDLLSRCSPALEPTVDIGHARIPADLAALLTRRNGFLGFSSALHVRPWSDTADGLAAWNSSSGWRVAYGSLVDGLFFFAEDLFGGQFAFSASDGVVAFDPETGDLSEIGRDIEDWARYILNDTDVASGRSIAERWTQERGPLASNCRLVPKIPFVLGGSFDLHNLYPMDVPTSLRLRGEIALQLRELPDGTQVEIQYVDD